MKLVLALSLLFGVSAQAHECTHEVARVVNGYLRDQGVTVKEYKALKIVDLTPGSYWQEYGVTATVVSSKAATVNVNLTLEAEFICKGMELKTANSVSR